MCTTYFWRLFPVLFIHMFQIIECAKTSTNILDSVAQSLHRWRGTLPSSIERGLRILLVCQRTSRDERQFLHSKLQCPLPTLCYAPDDGYHKGPPSSLCWDYRCHCRARIHIFDARLPKVWKGYKYPHHSKLGPWSF